MAKSNRGAAPPPPTAGVTEVEFQERFQEMFDRMLPDADRSAAFLSMSLNRLATLMRQQISAVYRPTGRSATAMHVLSALESLGPTTPTEIARLTRVTGPSVSSVLRGLRKDGLVEVVAADADGDARMRLVHVLPAGREVLKGVIRGVHEREMQWAAGIPEAERAALIGRLRSIAAEIEMMPTGTGDAEEII